MKSNISVYDNGGKTLDRYSIVFNDTKRKTNNGIMYDMIASSESGLGVYLHTEGMKGRHLGKKINFTDLNVTLQKQILIELN